MKKSLKIQALLFTGCFAGSIFFTPLMAQETALTLTTEQQTMMGLKTSALNPVSAYPSAHYSARAMIPLNKRHQISSTVSGKVVALHHSHGEIKQGELIAEIESPEFIQMQHQLIAAVADLEVAQQELKRTQALSKSGVSSVKNLNAIRAEVTKLQAEKQQARSQLTMAGMSEKQINALMKTQSVQAERLNVVSQVTGQVYDLDVMLNQYVEKNQTLITMGETETMVFEAFVAQPFSMQLHEGQAVSLPALNKQGVIGHIHSDVDQMTQTVDVHIKVANPNGDVFRGQLTPVQFLFEQSDKPSTDQAINSHVYQVSSAAISQEGADNMVFVETEKGIESRLIDVLNVNGSEMYFTFKEPVDNSVKSIFVQGSTALKSAFAAIESEE